MTINEIPSLANIYGRPFRVLFVSVNESTIQEFSAMVILEGCGWGTRGRDSHGGGRHLLVVEHFVISPVIVNTTIIQITAVEKCLKISVQEGVDLSTMKKKAQDLVDLSQGPIDAGSLHSAWPLY